MKIYSIWCHFYFPFSISTAPPPPTVPVYHLPPYFPSFVPPLPPVCGLWDYNNSLVNTKSYCNTFFNHYSFFYFTQFYDNLTPMQYVKHIWYGIKYNMHQMHFLHTFLLNKSKKNLNEYKKELCTVHLKITLI